MEMKEILTLIEKVSQSSLRVFSLKQNKDGIQIEMKKEEMSTVHSLADMAEVRSVQDGYSAQKCDQTEDREENAPETAFLAPMDGIFRCSEGGRMLLRIGKELNDESGVEIGSIKDEDEIPYNLSVKCLGEVTKICVQDGQRVKKGDKLFLAKIEKGDTQIEIL